MLCGALEHFGVFVGLPDVVDTQRFLSLQVLFHYDNAIGIYLPSLGVLNKAIRLHLLKITLLVRVSGLLKLICMACLYFEGAALFDVPVRL